MPADTSIDQEVFRMADKLKLDEYLDRVPPPAEIRARLSENLREREVLRRLLKISEKVRKSEEVSSCK
jgi:hypothetical protein